MNAPLQGLDYTRVSEDAAILCRRKDFPRAVNVLQRRTPEHRRWRDAFRRVAGTADRTLDGRPRAWMAGAIRELVTELPEPWLRAELAVDLVGTGTRFEVPDVLPRWTARQLWRLAEGEGLPFEYITQVTELPRGIDAEVNTARLVTDFRATAMAHREHALSLTRGLPPSPDAVELTQNDWLVRMQIESQKDAANRWRTLASRLLFTPGSAPLAVP